MFISINQHTVVLSLISLLGSSLEILTDDLEIFTDDLEILTDDLEIFTDDLLQPINPCRCPLAMLRVRMKLTRA